MSHDGVIDLRSDTVSLPTPEMRRAMAEAELGDDVMGEDPTVRRLEERAAELLGKEAGLFVTSGTQGNLVSLTAHLPRGGELIGAEDCHIINWEAAGYAVHARATATRVEVGPDGRMNLNELAAAFHLTDDPHEAQTGLVTLENTHANANGVPLDLEYTSAVGTIAHERRVPVHVDGARFFNAVVALGCRPAELAGPADSVTFCLSKGLACPVGSVVVGSREFIARARRARKLLGSGMRQVGVLAAPGLIALRDGPTGMIDRLAEDHANARRLAEALSSVRGVHGRQIGESFDPAETRTNMVIFRVAPIPREAFLAEVAARGVLLIESTGDGIRAATHYGVTEEDIEVAVRVIGQALAALGA